MAQFTENLHPTFLKHDNANVVDFLASTAAALTEAGQLGAKESDNLRLALSGIQADPVERDMPVLLRLLAQNAEFPVLAEIWFGRPGFARNLLRHSLKPLLAETAANIRSGAQLLLGKTELLINRPFTVFQNSGIAEMRSIYSAVLVDYAEALAAYADRIEDISTQLDALQATGFGPDTTTDEKLAAALGFARVETPSLPLPLEEWTKMRVGSILGELAAQSTIFIDQACANFAPHSAVAIEVGCDQLRSAVERFAGMALPRSQSLAVWETRRLALLGALNAVNSALIDLLKGVADVVSLAYAQSGQSHPLNALTNTVQRQLAADLVAAGTSPARAAAAAAAIADYCHEHKVDPSRLLAGELPRIHDALLPRSLELLQRLAGDKTGLALNDSASKQKALDKTKSLLAKISSAGTALALVLVPFLSGGCGLKTAPKSAIVDFRPDIPVRPQKKTEASSAPKTTEKQVPPGSP
jgi:hypothetical protein